MRELLLFIGFIALMALLIWGNYKLEVINERKVENDDQG